jgi:hypothetical protein
MIMFLPVNSIIIRLILFPCFLMVFSISWTFWACLPDYSSLYFNTMTSFLRSLWIFTISSLIRGWADSRYSKLATEEFKFIYFGSESTVYVGTSIKQVYSELFYPGQGLILNIYANSLYLRW